MDARKHWSGRMSQIALYLTMTARFGCSEDKLR